MREAFIVSSVRTPGCRRNKGGFKDTLPDELMAFILEAAVNKVPGLEKGAVDDLMVGCSFPEAEQGFDVGRTSGQIAGFPVEVSGATVNRFCASGLEAVALANLRVMAGWSDITIGGGVESMTYVTMGGGRPRPNPDYAAAHPEFYANMGITAENVARRYDISREAQDEFACASHIKAAAAREEGRFTEIIPTPATRYIRQPNGTNRKETFMQSVDDGIRPDTTIEGLAGLKPVFARNGTVTAGNSSQTTDGAAATVIMSEEKVKELGVKPVAKLKFYTTVGCRSDEMGVGPRYAVPKLLEMAGLTVEDIGLWELNEAFASQSLYCIRELGLDRYMDRVNVNGGAIALGHPLGCSGAKLCATLLANMQARGVRYGVETMCTAFGMGAAALFELIV